jgi:hypothetical protein
MSQKETTASIGRLEASESQVGNLSGLTELARKAFEQKRSKDCLDLTRAMLLLDPGNADALAMRLSIQSEMHRDLDSARAFIRQAQSAQNDESLEPQLPLVSKVETVAAVDSEGHLWVEHGNGRTRTVLASTVAALLDILHSKRWRGIRWVLVAATIIVVGVVLVPFLRFKTSGPPVESSLLALGSSDVPRATASEEVHPEIVETPVEKAPAPPSLPSSVPSTVPVSVAAKTPAAFPAPNPVAISRAATVLPDVPSNAGTGVLAISSAGAVDIFEGDAYLGSVPVSLELSAGEHTLEFRHGTLRKRVNYVINRNETSKATVVFDFTVQVNSKPWSEVFLEGVERKDLGQTPLSGVRVPIGGVLIFENPQFQAKRYRITGNETGIQVVFP